MRSRPARSGCTAASTRPPAPPGQRPLLPARGRSRAPARPREPASGRAGDQDLVRLEAGRSRHQGRGGLPRRDGRRQLLVGRDVGRVADQQVDGARELGREGVEPVALDDAHAGPRPAEPGEVGPRDRDGVSRAVTGPDLRGDPLAGDGERDRAGSGPEIDDHRTVAGRPLPSDGVEGAH